ncbi:GbsR/MarR family transcriptional regulator [Glaciibacter superstes]|uniref:GbsR/MarR family transcriptional regulator n=1 Tax=Glaciibacter superstes TaxID=501023 RepID=UPI0003B5C6C2|nr:transcriptional regulator [Glaciibacter superstes]
MTRSQRDAFIQGVGDLLASWNLSHATGRVYAQLLLCEDPISLASIGTSIDLSKGAVSTSVRELVSWGLARTIPQPGSRLLLVEAVGGLESLLAASHERAKEFVRTLRLGDELVHGASARERLHDVTALFENYVDAGERMLEQHRADRRG